MLITNVLSKENHEQLKDVVRNIDKSGLEVHDEYGRLVMHFETPANVLKAIYEIVQSITSEELVVKNSAMAVTYSKEYGVPNLPPHFDGDDTEMLFNYQIDSNTSWPLGYGTKSFIMKDNDVLMLQPNKKPHWRPKKEFQDGEYVTMLFVRFVKKTDRVTYDHLRLSINDPAFDEVYEYMKSME